MKKKNIKAHLNNLAREIDCVVIEKSTMEALMEDRDELRQLKKVATT